MLLASISTDINATWYPILQHLPQKEATIFLTHISLQDPKHFIFWCKTWIYFFNALIWSFVSLNPKLLIVLFVNLFKKFFIFFVFLIDFLFQKKREVMINFIKSKSSIKICIVLSYIFIIMEFYYWFFPADIFK